MTKYVTIEKGKMPRLPREASLDLTYRCNNNCRHCWLWLPANASEYNRELSFDEIKRIADEARGLGCRRWLISGGEPMLRPDFPDIFDYLTRKFGPYSLNTNGSLITPATAQLLTRKGAVLVSLYGANAQVHDHITRNPGSFEATMRGIAYLKEAGAEFIAQIVPMRDNYHQFKAMVDLALSLTPQYRIGAAWLYLSASGSRGKNREIANQRLSPSDVVALDSPDVCFEEYKARERTSLLESENCSDTNKDGRLFASCIASRQELHIDPYGQATFCAFVKDPALRYDLRVGTVEECWNKFIPSLAGKVCGGQEYQEYCGSCEYRADCRWCGVYGYLEHRRFSAPVQYLCATARERSRFKEEWKISHRRFFGIAGMTIQLDSDLPITEDTFDRGVKSFQVAGPGEDNISLEQHFFLPELNGNLGKQVFRNPPWVIHESPDGWAYLGISLGGGDKNPYQVAVFNREHTRARIYNHPTRADMFSQGNLNSLALFTTDQIWLARLLAERQGCLIHSSGVILNGKGLLFVGHSEAGKSTMASMLKGKAEILCDDRNVVRRSPDGFRIYGTWSHGDLPDVSPASAPLRGLLFLEQATENRVVPVKDKREQIRRLVACLVKPFETADWWEKELDLLEQIVEKTPCYVLKFDKSGAVVPLVEAL